jgi:hypothetical protein
MDASLLDRRVTCVFGNGVTAVSGKVLIVGYDHLVLDGKSSGVLDGHEAVHFVPYAGLRYIRLEDEATST